MDFNLKALSASGQMLLALNAQAGKHIYAGTANPNKVAAARRRTRLAKASRKANRP